MIARWSELGKWVVCGAWPYINTVPHLGTLIGSELSADVFARYLRAVGEEVVFVSGSDEHGTPIEVEAARRGVDPREITDRNHELVVELFKKFSLSFDNYTRTHNPVHIGFTQNLFMKIYDNGYIYEEEISQLYCRNCGRFLPDRFVAGVCPSCGYQRARGDQCEACGKVLDPLDLVEPRCSICGEKPVVETSLHWFFDLPKFSERIGRWLVSNTALSEKVRNFSLSWVREGLKPRAVTRDNLWGIPAPFPNAQNKTIYVWFEAVLGYITATVEWAERRGEPGRWREFWLDPETKSAYFIGKDNIPFHTVILPALLMASGEPYILPHIVSATEYLTFEGRKFSKSQGVGIWLDQAIAMLEADVWRYYLVKIRPETGDSNFSYDGLQAVVNADLNDSLGNFVHRVLTFVSNYFDGKVPEPSALGDEDRAMLEAVERTFAEVRGLLAEVRERQALETAVQLAREGNVYLNRREPWKLVKSSREEAGAVLYTASQAVKALALLLHPFTPNTSERILAMLSEKPAEALWTGDRPWLVSPGARIAKPTPLFEKLTDEKLESIKAGQAVH
ncbi:MAG: methionine--tRNA ligase [Candidatus Caldarchaeum sp.]|nr:methionine--tRNA ligase [Candidatus Caldarchaeum sp.]